MQCADRLAAIQQTVRYQLERKPQTRERSRNKCIRGEAPTIGFPSHEHGRAALPRNRGGAAAPPYLHTVHGRRARFRIVGTSHETEVGTSRCDVRDDSLDKATPDVAARHPYRSIAYSRRLNTRILLFADSTI